MQPIVSIAVIRYCLVMGENCPQVVRWAEFSHEGCICTCQPSRLMIIDDISWFTWCGLSKEVSILMLRWPAVVVQFFLCYPPANHAGLLPYHCIINLWHDRWYISYGGFCCYGDPLDHMIRSFRLSASPVSVPLQLLMVTICQPFTMFPDRLVGGAVFAMLCNIAV